jgi:hypothetical protein
MFPYILDTVHCEPVYEKLNKTELQDPIKCMDYMSGCQLLMKDYPWICAC